MLVDLRAILYSILILALLRSLNWDNILIKSKWFQWPNWEGDLGACTKQLGEYKVEGEVQSTQKRREGEVQSTKLRWSWVMSTDHD